MAFELPPPCCRSAPAGRSSCPTPAGEFKEATAGIGPVKGMSFSSDGRLLALGGEDGSIEVWEWPHMRRRLRWACQAGGGCATGRGLAAATCSCCSAASDRSCAASGCSKHAAMPAGWPGGLLSLQSGWRVHARTSEVHSRPPLFPTPVCMQVGGLDKGHPQRGLQPRALRWRALLLRRGRRLQAVERGQRGGDCAAGGAAGWVGSVGH